MITNLVQNFQLFIDGRGYAGECEEVKLPKVAVKTQEFEAGGTAGPVTIPMGGLEKLESEWTLHAVHPDVLTQMEALPGREVPITLRASTVDTDGTEKAVVAKMRGYFTEQEIDPVKAHEKVPLKCKFVADWYELTIGGTQIHEIGLSGLIFTVDGVDKLEQTRKNIGL